MSEQDAVLEGIFAQPEDDTPRLVYADWLQEHGEGEYAQFIRLQIERSRVQEKAERDRLLKAENAVWRKLRRKWSDLLTGEWGIRKEWFGRGFCVGTAEGQFTTNVDVFFARSPLWWPRLPIRGVWLGSESLSPYALLDSDYLSRLARLHLHHAGGHEQTFTEEFTVRFFGCGRFSRLEELHLSRVALSQATAEAMRNAPFLNNLKKLVVGYYALGHSGHLMMPGRITHLGALINLSPGGVAAPLRERLDELKPNYLVVPPGETSWRAMLAANRAT